MTTPSSTYRLQITPAFTLVDAVDVLPYLRTLGVGAVYLSPVLTSTPGSPHGYDCTDPTTIDPQRGGEEGWRAFVDAARGLGLGIVVDIVPNHQGIAVPEANPAWWSFLREGWDSPYAAWFDVDRHAGPVTLPVLGSDDDVAAITIDDSGPEPVLRYVERRLPLAPGSWSPGDDVTDILARQHYRLLGWRRANRDLTYRRFFAVNDLIGIRVEDPEVFAATHARILRWCAEGDIDGLRIDHPDGLRDPGAYLSKLREACGDVWLVTEKITCTGEALPPWNHDGTVGYEALREVTHVLAPDDAARWDALWRSCSGIDASVAEVEAHAKAEVARMLFPAEEHRLARLAGLSDADPDDVAAAFADIAAGFEIYRTYLPFGRDDLAGAVARATASVPARAGLHARLHALLAEPGTEIAARFQQLTGPVVAKGVEDTACYRHNRALSLNEVGGDPATLTGSLEAFHAAMTARHRDYPRAMTALSTHDTKRAEDVRAGMLALLEMPEVFEPFARHVEAMVGTLDPSFAFGLAQTLACGPTDRARVAAWIVKAMREAAVATSWLEPNLDAEAAVVAAATAILDGSDATGRALWEDLQHALMVPTLTNVLAQKAIALMIPGVPDVYQGTETLDDSLVDPDNRRPVDFAALSARLADPQPAHDIRGTKQRLVQTVLTLRRERPALFDGYAPLRATGPAAGHVVAFDRGGALLITQRSPVTLAAEGGWRDTVVALPEGTWIDALSGRDWSGMVRVADVLASLPVAVLTR